MKKVLLFSLIVVMSIYVFAGSLTPSAAPGPTMKTLDEVEPRIAINSVNTPGDSNFEYIISNSGSYYLTGDVSTTKSCIRVDVDDVTIDLMGYTLKGPDTGTRSGIYMIDRTNVEVRNGTIRDFDNGIFEISINGTGHRIINVRAISNITQGIHLSGHGHTVKDCTASENGASANTTAYGMYIGGDSTVTGNVAYKNGFGASFSVYGIFAGDGCVVSGNSANNNGVSVDGNSNIYGIFAGKGSVVSKNTSYYNGDSSKGTEGYFVIGISAASGCSVVGNAAYHNGNSSTSTVYGIYLYGNSFVDQNTAYDNNGTNMNSSSSCTYGLNHAP